MNPCEQIQLPDGRHLTLSTFGAVDGLPIFYQHGFPGCRLEAALVEESAASLGLRLLALDRPGYGGSDYDPQRLLVDWPVDVAAVADVLRIERFAVLGVSGGGPCALACASQLGERVLATGIVCGLGPLAGTGLLADMEWPARFSFTSIFRYPRLAAPFFRYLLGPLMKRWPQLALAALKVASPDADRQVLRDPQVRDKLLMTIREAFRAGARGAIHDLQLYASNRGEEINRIKTPIRFWHGVADRTVPITHARFLSGLIEHADIREYPHEGHFSLPVNCGDVILAELKQMLEERNENH